nr:hypothetical protein [Lactiplantibacillus plantarum]
MSGGGGRERKEKNNKIETTGMKKGKIGKNKKEKDGKKVGRGQM